MTDVVLEHGASGQFDVSVDGALRLSRHTLGRFPTDGEIDSLAP